MKNFISIFLVIAFLSGVFLLVTNTNKKDIQKIKPENIKYVAVGDTLIKVDLAISKEEQEKGLSGREFMLEDEGMLFVFDNAGKYPFWMKDMNFPIDIIWLDEFARVIYIERDLQPSSYPDLFGPNAPSKYVLETVSGFSEKQQLEVGDKVQFLSITPSKKQ